MNVSIGERWEEFVAEAVRSGRYGSVSEVVREGLRLVEERETKLKALRETISTVENGQRTTYPFDVALAHQMYGELFGPFASGIAAAKHLIFEPDGAMLSLPPNLLVMDQASVDGYIAADPGVFKTVGDPVGSDQFGFIFKPGSDLVAPFNAAIAAMKADGTIDGLNRKWFYEYSTAK